MERYTPYVEHLVYLHDCGDFCNQILRVLYKASYGTTNISINEQTQFIGKHRRFFNKIRSRANKRNIYNVFIREGFQPLTAYDMSMLIINLYKSYTGYEQFTHVAWLYDTRKIFTYIIQHMENTHKNINIQIATLHSISRLMEAIGRHDIACEYKNLVLYAKDAKMIKST